MEPTGRPLVLLISSACSVQDDGSVVIAEHGIWAVVSGLSALFPEAVGRMMRKKKNTSRTSLAQVPGGPRRLPSVHHGGLGRDAGHRRDFVAADLGGTNQIRQMTIKHAKITITIINCILTTRIKHG